MTPADLARRLHQGPLLLDGGLGSLLISMGLEQGRPPDGWNLEHPDRVREAHRRYVEAGSDVVHTNTFGSTAPKLAGAQLAERCVEINRVAAQLALDAALAGGTGGLATDEGHTLVAGDIGPTGLFLPPMGEASEVDLQAAFVEQTETLAAAGVDLLSIETMYDLREALCAVRAAVATGLPVLASMTFEARPRGFFTIMGDPLEASLRALAEAGAHAVGFNCSVTSDVMLAMVERAVAAVRVAVVAQPNAGQPRTTPAGVVYDADPDRFAADLARMVQCGARLVGGCCGTTPEFMRRARAALDRPGR